MEGTVLSTLFIPALKALEEKYRVDEELHDEFSDIYSACVRIGRPKAVYVMKEVRQDQTVTYIGEEAFESRVMYRNFKNAEIRRAFVYAVTCGRELYELAAKTEDPLERWWIDTFSQDAMRAADSMMTETLNRTYGLGHTARMNPGSLPDFPITCQAGLFRLLREETQAIGLELTATFLMLPYKSVSGIIYETDTAFENCMLCPRKNCPTRRAAFRPEMMEDYIPE